ncbi:MAG TPA: hypothetical protein DCX92_03490 [Bacteroidetes bacterium]|nr:hypothetical protein [Bacteroidota bacterium]HRE11494.1 hypothetical protein [Ignavibacteria bacterium]
MNNSTTDRKVDIFLHSENPTSKPSNADTHCPRGISNLIGLADYIKFLQLSHNKRKFFRFPSLCVDGGCIIFHVLPYSTLLKNKKVITEKFSIKKIDFYKEILSVLVKLLKINNENDFIRVSRALLRIMKPDNTIIGIEMRDAGSMLKLKTKKKK